MYLYVNGGAEKKIKYSGLFKYFDCVVCKQNIQIKPAQVLCV